MEIVWSVAVLTAIGFAIVKGIESELEQHWGIVPKKRIWLYARAGVAVGAVLLTGLLPTVPPEVLLVLTALAAGLGVLGYWPEVQQIGARVKGE
jgi:hypothetical protein